MQARGQAGALATPATDFGPWGGSVTFDTTANWSFAGTGGTPGAGQYDFLTVALHELGHVLGIGTSSSWFTDVNVSNNTFTGPQAEASYGGPVPLDAGAGDGSPDGHWADGTLSGGQVTVMNPVIPAGARRLFTALDWAGLEDIGWNTDSSGSAGGTGSGSGTSGGGGNPSLPASTPPTIVSEQVLTKGRGKRAKVIGFLLNFSTALNASNAQNASNYSIVATAKKGRKLVAQSLRFWSAYNAATHSVSLVLSATQAFVRGGKLTVMAAPPSGIADASGVFLDGEGDGVAGGNAVFNIRPGASGIGR